MDPRVHGIALSVWRYDTMRNGWTGLQCTGTPAAYELLLTFLGELDRAHDGVTRKTIPLEPLRFDPTGFKQSKPIVFEKLKLEVVDATEELRELNVSYDGSVASIVVTRSYLPQLVDTFESARDGGSDFSFGPTTRKRAKAGVRDRESLDLMFW